MRIGVDIGGTFTDVVLAHPERGLLTTKSLSTPDDPSRGVVDGLALLAENLGVGLGELLGGVNLFLHGTTVATNILVERKGAKIGLITTQGFGDLIELRDGTKSDRYSLRTPYPEVLIPRPLRKEVTERVLWDGSVHEALSVADVERALEDLREEGVEGLVVCFLHAHRNPEHELQVRRIVERTGWKSYLSLSHEILGREGEYDRVSTAAINTYVGPGLHRYLQRLEDRLSSEGLARPMLIMQSSGGVLPVGEAANHAVGAITSGPAGGAMAGAMLSRREAIPLAVTYDMGGTSTDVCLIQKGVPLERQSLEVHEMRIAVPAVDITALGTGGGSIAWIDQGGILDLGPMSAGAAPGPASYGRGGERPTLTDANLILGYISDQTFLGGRMNLSTSRARHALTGEIAGVLELSVEEAAMAINALANSRVAEGIRAATVRRGLDPRDFVLIAFGGAGGVHADAVARELRIPKVIIPREASVLSALGMLSTDVRHDFQVTVDARIPELAADHLRTLYEGIAEPARCRLKAEGFADEAIQLIGHLQCRYERQVYTVEVSLSEADLRSDSTSWIADRFVARYEELYRHAHQTEAGVVDSLHVSAFGMLPPIQLPTIRRSDERALPRGQRAIYLDGWIDVPVYWFDDLWAGSMFDGPAVVDSASTSILVLPGSRAVVDGIGSLCIHPGAVE
ncbi:hydantoinase/oxoprolinase family protein [Mesorhizobium sp. AD1-1]|uniref:hydantoinase/oxoprolinase family protein n=1 Tax=Mesorhizobium sp. AD1-1 TaxID=2876621 RepID=UPI001CCF8E4C|nr:hydantoinase/oxoprolinase family protein [Mesorhizobium sp. AD1-1]MBZ9719212.1 hydantoinase/oxoprolinase family protein [Mesorhizobium sp. AD1-1]